MSKIVKKFDKKFGKETFNNIAQVYGTLCHKAIKFIRDMGLLVEFRIDKEVIEQTFIEHILKKKQ